MPATEPITETSVITLARRNALCKITSGALTTFPAITKIAFGDAGVDAAGNPIPPTETQTALNHQVGVYDIDGVTYPNTHTARYSVTIPKADLVGKSISEAALVDSSGALHAIKTMFAKRKDDGVAFAFEFDDEF